jgi:hypothetical protein
LKPDTYLPLDILAKIGNNRYRNSIVHLSKNNRETEVGKLPKERASFKHLLDLKSEATFMKLTYRGIEYNHKPSVIDVRMGEVIGTYRGQAVNTHHLINPPVLQPKLNLKYRGASYNTQGNVPVTELKPEALANLCFDTKARGLMVNRTKGIKNRQRVMLTRLASEIGLNASANWTHIQGKVQPSFRVMYDRACTAMS